MGLRVATLGAGFFSQFHRDSWARLESVELVAVADQNIEAARATGLTAYRTLEDMLASEEPDVLDIILPPAAHAEAIQKALCSGVTRIICQKPFCTSLEEARSITAQAKTQNATLLIHENFRFQPWFRVIKDAIEDGKVGTVLQMTFRLRPGDGQGPHAYLDRQSYFQSMKRFMVHETGVHYVDVFRYLFGNPSAVYADLRQVNPVIAGEDAGFLIFDHPGGVRTVLDANRNLDHAAENLRCTMGEALVEGTKGTLTVKGNGSVQLRAFGEIEASEVLGPNTHKGFGGDCVHAFQTHAVLGFLSEAPLETLAEDYLTVLEIEDDIYRSAREGRKFAIT